MSLKAKIILIFIIVIFLFPFKIKAENLYYSKYDICAVSKTLL